MTCADFDRWLDDGGSDREAAAPRAHAGGCARCAAALAAMVVMETMLARPTARVSGDFTDVVMRRVAVAEKLLREPGSQSARTRATPPVFDWWVRAAAEPASVLAAIVAALLVWQGEVVRQAAIRIAPIAAQGSIRLLSGLVGRHSSSEVAFAISVAALPLVALASFSLYRWMEALARAGSRATS